MKKFFKFLLTLVGIAAIGLIILMIIPDSWLSSDEDTVTETNSSPSVTTVPTEPAAIQTEPVPDNKITTASTPVTDELSSIRSSHGVRQKADYSDSKTVTILCYINGSNLETEYQEATTDISEMVDAPYNKNVNIVLQTMGTKKWSSKFGIASNRSQRYIVRENDLELVDDSLGQLDCTRSSTLSDFITWGVSKYPADRYILLFWDHGGGPVYGFGYDEYQSYEDSMTIDEIQLALANAGITFDFIGMDCCIMSCLEVCCAMYGYCDYMVLSEDFEPGLGWSYEGWLTALSKNPAIDTVELCKIICDDCVRANQNDIYGDECILSLLDESVMRVLYTAWTDFAFANEEALLGSNYSRPVHRGLNYRIPGRLASRDEDYQLADYNITDIMAVAQNIDSPEATALSSAVKNAIVYSVATEGDKYLTGLSVTLPYGDNEFYSSQKSIFRNCGFSEDYLEWLAKFTSVPGISSYFNYDSWDDLWSGWDDYEDDYDWSTWDYNDEDYWDDYNDDDISSWWDWDFEDYWNDDWYEYDDNDYHYDGYCSDDYWDTFGDYYDDYWNDFWGYSDDDYDYDDDYDTDSYSDWSDWLGWLLFDDYDDYNDGGYGYDDYGYGYDDYGYGYDDYGYDGYGYDDYGYDGYGYDDYGYDGYGYDDYGYGYDYDDDDSDWWDILLSDYDWGTSDWDWNNWGYY